MPNSHLSADETALDVRDAIRPRVKEKEVNGISRIDIACQHGLNTVYQWRHLFPNTACLVPCSVAEDSPVEHKTKPAVGVAQSVREHTLLMFTYSLLR